MGLTQAAEAKIIYTPANKVIPYCQGHSKLCFKLDLDHDKIADFYFPLWSMGHSVGLGVVPALKQKKNEIWGTISTARCSFKTCQKYPVASALSSGVTVGANSVKFQPKHYAMWETQNGSFRWEWGQWYNVQNKYLGLLFYIKGKVHYGWARLNIKNGLNATLTGYAYETVANKPIIAGKTKGPDVITLEPASLGRLAQGSAGRSGK